MSGYADQTINKIRRWESKYETFNEYIRDQMSKFSEGMSNAMAAVQTFTNIEGCVMNENW